MGFLSLLVGVIVIDIFGHTYRQIDTPLGPIRQATGVTPMYYVGGAIIGFGILSFLCGVIMFFLSRE